LDKLILSRVLVYLNDMRVSKLSIYIWHKRWYFKDRFGCW